MNIQEAEQLLQSGAGIAFVTDKPDAEGVLACRGWIVALLAPGSLLVKCSDKARHKEICTTWWAMVQSLPSGRFKPYPLDWLVEHHHVTPQLSPESAVRRDGIPAGHPQGSS
jgi:hypothetical protein